MGGAGIGVRPMEAADAEALLAFFTRVPVGDRTFFREDVLKPDVVDRWLTDPQQHRFVAVDGDDVVGHLALVRGVGWSAHVVELRLVVDPARRRHGLGRALARRGVAEAVSLGATKLVVEVVADQEATVAMFTVLGFEAEGLLRDHVRGQDGEVHDLLLLAHLVEPMWDAMRTTGLEDLVLDDG
jgi:L-amino acid N-acyltransferase YncA